MTRKWSTLCTMESDFQRFWTTALILVSFFVFYVLPREKRSDILLVNIEIPNY